MNRLVLPQTGLSRRGLIAAGAASLGGLLVSGCNRLATAPTALKILGSAEGLTRGSQRLILAGQPLAREFQTKDISPNFKVNGTSSPASDEYDAMVANGFKDWKLSVDGLVQHPLAISLAQFKAMPARSQITRHDCVEGWSAIAQWTGPQLGPILAKAGLLPNARYVVFHCADDFEPSLDGSGRYYESIDLFDAFHPQTILAHTMNSQPLSVGHGAPIRLRVERQLGYKQAKYVMRIEVTDRLDKISGGNGGFWEDRGYEWYAGI